MNPIKDAIILAGSVTEFARTLGVTPQAVCFWRDSKRQIPADKCPIIERVTVGAVTCEMLRPDVDWAYIRDTAKNPATPTNPVQTAAATVVQGA
jgi:DNA-binding transcriptional regulator YdaS (Cro superfamily)